jgi:hypothetical protein
MPALSFATRIDTERIMATKQSGAGRVKSSGASRRLAAAAQQAVERAAEAKKRVRDAKAELKSLRKLAKVAKKAAKVALKKAKTRAAKPAAAARADQARSAAARSAAAPSVRGSASKSRRKRTSAKASTRRRQPAAEVARSVIRRMQKDESGGTAANAASRPDQGRRQDVDEQDREHRDDLAEHPGAEGFGDRDRKDLAEAHDLQHHAPQQQQYIA